MRTLIAVLTMLCPLIAVAQAPATAAPASAAAPEPDWYSIAYDFVHTACTREQACGCSKGVDACVDMFVKADLPIATLACVAHEPCEVICENENAGMPGTKLHTHCLAPSAKARVTEQFTQGARVAACETGRRCGCEPRDVKACVADMATSPNISGHFWACAASQPCKDFCDPNTSKPGGGVHTRCMLPSTAKMRAATAQSLQNTLKLNAQMQQRMHRTTMGIIRNMAPTPTRVDVYDANGNYIRSE